MKRSGDIRWGELRLGLFIFVAMALFLWASIQGGTNLFRKSYLLHTEFGNVQGVVPGAAIWFEGVEVGAVKDIGFVRQGGEARVLVTFSVNGRVWPMIRRDSHVRVQALNVFGEKFMEVTPGSADADPVAQGDTLASKDPADFNALMDRGKGIVDNLDTLATDLRSTMRKIKNGEGSLGRLVASDELYTSLDRTVKDIGSLTEHLDASQAEMRRSLTAVAASLDSLGRRMDRGEGTLGRLSRDPALYDRLASTAGHADSLFGRMERGEGNLGRLSKDEALYKNLSESLDRLNKMLTDMQKNPHKYFKFSVF